MKFIVRYLGLVISENKFEPGEYIIGRGPEAQIRLTQDFISRQHGRLFYKDGQWFYQDLRKSHPHYNPKIREINEHAMVELENDIDLMEESYLHQHETQIYDIQDLRSMAERASRNKRRLKFVSAAVSLLTVLLGGGYTYYHFTKPMDAETLLSFVRPKIVEFETITNEQDKLSLMKFASLQDSDVRDSVGFCSGFIVAPNVVLTAFHCIRGQYTGVEINTDFKLKTHDNIFHEVKRVLGLNVIRDYAYLEVPGLEQYGHLKFLDKTSIGLNVYTIGNVAGEGIAIRDGITASMTKDPNNPEIEYLRFSAAASPGNSGGPLVDGYGNIVGIVFAGTRSENYNIATPSEQLVIGKSKFVDNLETKQIEIDTDGILNFDVMGLLYRLNLPPLEGWRDNPQYVRDFESLAFKINVPMEIKAFSEQYIASLNQEIRRKYDNTRKMMVQDGKGEASWNDILNEKMPLIVVDTIAAEKSSIRITANEEFIPNSVNYFIPPGRYAIDAYQKNSEYRANLLNMVRAEFLDNKKDSDLTYSTYSDAYGKISLASFSGSQQLYSRFKLNSNITKNNRLLPSADYLARSFVGGNGMLFSTGYFSYVRPKAHREFVLKELPSKPVEKEFTDRLKRKWIQYDWDIFGMGMLSSYCLSLPTGYACTTTMNATTNDSLNKILQQNAFDYQISEWAFSQMFWDIDTLIDFQASEHRSNLRLLDDVTIHDSGKYYIVKLKTLDKTFKIPKNSTKQRLRFISASLKDKNQSNWFAIGMEVYQPIKKLHKICGVVVEPDKIPLWQLAKIQRDLNKQKNIKEKYVKFIKFDHGNDNLRGQLMGYCNEFKKSDDSTAYTNGDVYPHMFSILKQ